jgi:hypothetical protein
LNATSLEQLNLLIWERLEVLNEAPRTQAVSRSEEFLEHERETLMPLPASDWEPITVKNVKVQRNGRDLTRRPTSLFRAVHLDWQGRGAGL